MTGDGETQGERPSFNEEGTAKQKDVDNIVRWALQDAVDKLFQNGFTFMDLIALVTPNIVKTLLKECNVAQKLALEHALEKLQ